MTELKEGAKYRVTLEGVYEEQDYCGGKLKGFRFKGDNSFCIITSNELAHAKIEEIEND